MGKAYFNSRHGELLKKLFESGASSLDNLELQELLDLEYRQEIENYGKRHGDAEGILMSGETKIGPLSTTAATGLATILQDKSSSRMSKTALFLSVVSVILTLVISYYDSESDKSWRDLQERYLVSLEQKAELLTDTIKEGNDRDLEVHKQTNTLILDANNLLIEIKTTVAKNKSSPVKNKKL